MDQYEQQLEALLREPISSVIERERTEFDRLLAGCNGRIVLFGSGNLGQKALRCLRSAGIEPLAFADNGERKWGTTVEGVPVVSPEDAVGRFGSSALFVVTIWSEGHRYTETKKQLMSLGCTHVTPVAPLRWKFPEQLLPDYCNDLPHKVVNEAVAVSAAARLWVDRESCREYLSQVRWRLLGDYDGLGPASSEEQYFPHDLFSFRPDEVFVDCGAFDGDTARKFVARNPNFHRIIALEPDPENFHRLSRWSEWVDPTHRAVVVHNLAVGARRECLAWNPTGTESSCAASTGIIQVDCAPLDEIASGYGPTMIKMDIEGAELDALAGACKVILENHPVLAICVYHSQNDLWRVPLHIASVWQEYKLFLRPHGDEGRELVCYAVPPHRLAGDTAC
jgi:FkbM family methyltransferase